MHGPDPTLSDDTVLDALFPAPAVSVLSTHARTGVILPGEEEVAARIFVPARRAEFAHGRDCARRSLRRLGVAPVAIPVGQSREPVWPPGIVGSISHAGAVAAAVVARCEAFASLGLDLEPDEPLDAALVAQVCRPGEVVRLAALDADPGRAARRIFSMKEAAYKALWPLQRAFMEFHELEVQPVPACGTFTVVVRAGACPPALAARLTGRFMRLGSLLASGAVITRDPTL